jgi:intracellular sulfur oxidation DsrE/DsrF family protein
MSNNETKTDRRRFLGSLASGAAMAGLATLPSFNLNAADDFVSNSDDDPDAWFNKIKGKHRIVFDATESKNAPEDIMPLAWARIFMVTNGMTGTTEKDLGVVVVLRHSGIFYGLNDSVWSKYKIGETFKLNDRDTKVAGVRNQFWKPKTPFSVPGVGPVPIAINELQDSGAMFCICNMALTVYSAVAAGALKMDEKTAYNDFKAGVLPGIQIVPSGVWAVGRAQEHGCQYCFAG